MESKSSSSSVFLRTFIHKLLENALPM